MLPRMIYFPILVLITSLLFNSVSAERSEESSTHPLMPGIRTPDIQHPGWPRTLHDSLATGFSPLSGGMDKAPGLWKDISLGGELHWVEVFTEKDVDPGVLVDDGRLRRIKADGTLLWTQHSVGTLEYLGNLRENGLIYGIFSEGATLTVLDISTGNVFWRHTFDPVHTEVKIAVADPLPEKSGLEVAVFQQYGKEGYLLNFSPEGPPQVLWGRDTVRVEDEMNERIDHGCHIAFDLTDPERPILWNQRHHRVRGFEARTGRLVAELIYEMGIDKEESNYRRNYGPMSLSQEADGSFFLSQISERIETHVHGIQLFKGKPPELSWYHYYGNVYFKPGVVVEAVNTLDIDADGRIEMLYAVRDPDKNLQSSVRIREVATGELEEEFKDQWFSGFVPDFGGSKRHLLLLHPSPNRSMKKRGPLEIHAYGVGGNRSSVVARYEDAQPWGPLTLDGARGQELLLRKRDSSGVSSLVRCQLNQEWVEVAQSKAESLLQFPILDVLPTRSGMLYLVAGSRGTLEALTWEGVRRWEVPLIGGSQARLAAVDLNGDGAAEVSVMAPGKRVRVYDFSENKPREILNVKNQSQAVRNMIGPLWYDFTGDGELCLVTSDQTEDGRLLVRAVKKDGALLWETILPGSTIDNGGRVTAWNAGQFVPDGQGGSKSGLTISVYTDARLFEGMYFLDGETGNVLWFRDLYKYKNFTRGFRSLGVPGAFDYDGDGIEEINTNLYSTLSLIRADASFALDLWTESAFGTTTLYNSFIPVYKTPEAELPHWFVTLGRGAVGLINPEGEGESWGIVVGYDFPFKSALIDCDGDGTIEVGYTLQNSNTFVIRDLWTGEIETSLELPEAPNAPTLSADIDGDGRGEFLTGNYCIGVDASGKTSLEWELPIPLGWGIIADVDGDGLGELLTHYRGTLYVMKAGEKSKLSLTDLPAPLTQQDALRFTNPFLGFPEPPTPSTSATSVVNRKTGE